MTPRFICPHCHSPIDPQTMDPACSASAQFRICPDCDVPIVLALTGRLAEPHPATVPVPSRACMAGNCTR